MKKIIERLCDNNGQLFRYFKLEILKPSAAEKEEKEIAVIKMKTEKLESKLGNTIEFFKHIMAFSYKNNESEKITEKMKSQCSMSCKNCRER